MTHALESKKVVLKNPVNAWQIEPDYSDDEHHYLVDGVRMPSVTTILKCLDKPALLPWAVKMMEKKATELFAKECDKEGSVHLSFSHVQEILENAKKNFREARDEAGDIGSVVHDAVEQHLLGTKISLTGQPDGVKAGFKAFIAWAEQTKMRPVRVEAYLASKQIGVAGKCDFVGFIDDKLVVADWKTSTGIYDEYLMQVAAYSIMIEEMTGKPIEGAWVIRFDKKTGKFNDKKDSRFIDRDEISKRFNAFVGLTNYHKAINS